MYAIFKIENDIEKVEKKLKIMQVVKEVFSKEIKSREIGKYFTKNDILEKLGFLNPDEYLIAKNYLAKIKNEKDMNKIEAILCVYGKLNKTIVFEGEEICGWKIEAMSKKVLLETYSKQEILEIYQSGI